MQRIKTRFEQRREERKGEERRREEKRREEGVLGVVMIQPYPLGRSHGHNLADAGSRGVVAPSSPPSAQGPSPPPGAQNQSYISQSIKRINLWTRRGGQSGMGACLAWRFATGRLTTMSPSRPSSPSIGKESTSTEERGAKISTIVIIIIIINNNNNNNNNNILKNVSRETSCKGCCHCHQKPRIVSRV